MRNSGLDPAISYWRKLWNPRRLRVSSVNKTAQSVVLPSIKGNLRLLWELHTKFPGFNRSLNTKWKSPPNEPLVSAGLKCLALGVASVNNTFVFTLLNYKRTRTENLLILRCKQNRLSQVLTLFYSRIPEQNFLFDMIYDCLFESKLHLLNKPSALCKLSFV